MPDPADKVASSLADWAGQPGTDGLPVVPGYHVLSVLVRATSQVGYPAPQVALARIVALKVIVSPDLRAPDARARLLREAPALARLQHPHVLRIHEVSEPVGWPLLCLELATGGSLASRVGP